MRRSTIGFGHSLSCSSALHENAADDIVCSLMALPSYRCVATANQQTRALLLFASHPVAFNRAISLSQRSRNLPWTRPL